MSQRYEIRLYRQGDEEGIVSLLQNVFGGWPHFDLNCSSVDFWRWRYLDNPIKTSLIILATMGDEIVGCYQTIPQRVVLKDKTILWVDMVDAAVHPAYRKMGVYNKMLQTTFDRVRENGIDMWKGETSNPILVKSISERYPYFPKPVIIQVRIQDIDLHLEKMPVENKIIKKVGYQLLRKLNEAKNYLTRRDSRDHSLRIEEVEAFDERIEAFWEILSNHYDCIVERRQDYLNWRYRDPRAGNFTVKQAVNEGSIQGYIVYRIDRYREDYPIGTIVDLVTLPDKLEVAKTLVADAVEYFDSHEINFCRNLIVKNHPCEGVFNCFGFLDSRTKVHLFYDTLVDVDPLEVLRSSPPSRIHFSYGDTDWI